MAEGLEVVLHLIVRYEVVERLYLNGQGSVQRRLGYLLVDLYATVLMYLLGTHRYYCRNTAKRVALSIFQGRETGTIEYLGIIKRKQDEIDRYLSLISDGILSNIDKTMSSLMDGLKDLNRHKEDLEQFGSIMNEMKGNQLVLERERGLLESVLRDLNEPVNRTASQLSSIDDYLKEEERLKVFEWLSHVPYMRHHRSKAKALLPGSGQWLLRKPEWMEWMESSSPSILWLHGIPGSGKSMLVAHVIEYLQERNLAHCNPAPLTYFYCARSPNEPERADPDECLRCILEQLSSAEEGLPIREPVSKAYLAKRKEAKGRKPEKLDLDETVDVIVALLKTNPATILIDGLDECEPTLRQRLLDGLSTIIKESDNVVKVFVSSRDDRDLVHRLAETPNLYIHATDNADDIQRFVHSRVDEAVSKGRLLCGRVSQNLRNSIVTTLIQKAEGMFRLVSLHIETLCDPYRIKTEANVHNALDHLPRDLKKSYKYVMSQISNSEEPNPKIAERTMKFLLCAQPTLDSQALLLAVSIEIPRFTLDRSDILSICCNLVIYDAETDRFRFAHLSVQEYLLSLDDFSLAASNAIATEMLLCVRAFSELSLVAAYLENCNQLTAFKTFRPSLPFVFDTNSKILQWFNSPERKEAFADANDSTLRSKTPGGKLGTPKQTERMRLLDQYTRIYWAGHAQLSGLLRKSDPLWSLLQNFLRFHGDSAPGICWGDSFYCDSELIFWMPRSPHRLWSAKTLKKSYFLDYPSFALDYPLTLALDYPLLLASAFGFSELVADILEDIYEHLRISGVWISSSGRYIFIYAMTAARFDHVEVLRVLLDKSQAFDRYEFKDLPDFWHVILIQAALNDSLETLEMILDRKEDGFVIEEDIITVIKQGQQPLIALDILIPLFASGRDSVVTEAILKEAFSIEAGGEAIVRQLLEHTAEINITMDLANCLVENLTSGHRILAVFLETKKTIRLIEEKALGSIYLHRATSLAGSAHRRFGSFCDSKRFEGHVCHPPPDLRALVDELDEDCTPPSRFYINPNDSGWPLEGRKARMKVMRESTMAQMKVMLGFELLIRLQNVEKIEGGNEVMITLICEDNLWNEEADFLVDLLVSRSGEQLELTSKHIRLAKSKLTAERVIFKLLSRNTKLPPSTIATIVSEWDYTMVESLLGFRRFEITPEIVGATARNLTHGLKIIELLLKKELETEIQEFDHEDHRIVGGGFVGNCWLTPA